MRQKRRPPRDYDDDEDVSLSDNLAAVSDRLDSLTRHLERSAGAGLGPARRERRRPRDDWYDSDTDDLVDEEHYDARPGPRTRSRREESTSDAVAEAIARLDRRLDQVIAESRAASEFAQRPAYLPQQPVAPPLAPAQNQVDTPAPAAAQRVQSAVYAHQAPLESSPRTQPPETSLFGPGPGPAAEPFRSAAAIPTNWGAAGWGAAATPVHRPQARAIEHHAPMAPPQAPVWDRETADTDSRAWHPPDADQSHAAHHPAERQDPRQDPSQDSDGPNRWALEISARQRALDGEPEVAPEPAPNPASNHAPAPAQVQQPAPPYVGPDLSGLESHLRDITSQIAAMHRPYEEGLAALRSDLAEIGRALTEAVPRHAIETLEQEIRSLSERVDHIRQSRNGADTTTLAGLENGLAEVRDTLRSLTPAEGLVGVDEAVRGLSRKIDKISVSQQDPNTLQQIEHAITSLRGVVSNVASDGALAQLAAEVHGLAGKFERAALTGGSDEALAKIDERISTLVESGRSVPRELEHAIRTLSEQLERNQLSQGDQFALRSLEDRIVKLVEKLDASDTRLGSLSAIERGIGDLLVAVGELRTANRPPPEDRARPAEQPVPKAAFDAPVTPVQSSPMHPAAPLQATPEIAYQPPHAAPARVTPPPPAQSPAPARSEAPRPEPRRPIDPNLPPDTPIEPGMGVPRLKPGSPAARIAASEAALSGARPQQTAEAGGKSAAIAAARNAARIVTETVAVTPRPARSKASAASKATAATPAAIEVSPPDSDDAAFQIDSSTSAAPRGRNILRRYGKALLIGTSVAVIVLGAAHVALGVLMPAGPSAISSRNAPAQTHASARQSGPSRAMPTIDAEAPQPGGPTPEAKPEITPDTSGQASSSSSSFFDPRTVLQALPKVSNIITGSIDTDRKERERPHWTTKLPASIGPVLKAALAAGNPAAAYEMGQRYLDGRGVKQDLKEAEVWLERAAKANFAPAQFRLAGLKEKGQGISRDLAAARRLYKAAADKGHGKAMHNLAVLHAEGADSTPDYKGAAQWFRKAAEHGVTDSQYNLAILLARGIGVQQDLTESYKWFALAAAGGDSDAGRKRDDVAARLDKAALSAAKQAVERFKPRSEPDEATNLQVPPGGWDRSVARAR